jgi:cyclic pyranopterin phosphate synthase
MVRVGDKPVTQRACVARAEVHMAPATLARIAEGTLAKGDVFATARIAAVQAAKRTGEWIPLCHPLALDGIDVDLQANPARSAVEIEVRVEAHARTGVEMEALVAASAAALTIYDMCKAVDRAMTVERVRLVAKRGGKSGVWERPGEAPSAGPSRSPRG